MKSQPSMPGLAEALKRKLMFVQKPHESVSADSQERRCLLRRELTIDRLETDGRAPLHRVDNSLERFVDRKGKRNLLPVRPKQRGRSGMVFQEVCQPHHLVEVVRRLDDLRLTGRTCVTRHDSIIDQIDQIDQLDQLTQPGQSVAPA